MGNPACYFKSNVWYIRFTHIISTLKSVSLPHLVPLCFQGFLDIHRTELIIMYK